MVILSESSHKSKCARQKAAEVSDEEEKLTWVVYFPIF